MAPKASVTSSQRISPRLSPRLIEEQPGLHREARRHQHDRQDRGDRPGLQRLDVWDRRRPDRLLARMSKYAPKNPPKNMTSEEMNRIIPSSERGMAWRCPDGDVGRRASRSLRHLRGLASCPAAFRARHASRTPAARIGPGSARRSCAAAGARTSPTRACSPPTGRRVAVGGFRIVMMKLTMKMRTDSAIRNAPSVAIWLRPVKSCVRRVVGDASLHPHQPQDVHREEGQVEPDDQDPELDLAERLGQELARSSSASRSRSPAKIANTEPPTST